MPTILQLRRGSTAENDTYTGSVGELTVDTTLSTVRLHDGSTAGGSLVGNLQKNIQIGITGDNEIDTSSGNLTIDSAGGTVTIDDNLTVSGNLTVQGTTTTVNSTTIDVQNSLRFEGSSSNDFETNLTVTDPTADRTITFPDATGNVALFATAPTAAITDGSAGQFLKTDGSGALSFATVNTDLVADTTPQLGGNLDLNGNQITTSAGAYIRGDDGTGHGLIFYSDTDFKFEAGGSDFTFSNGNVVGVNNLAASTLNNHTVPGGSAGTVALTSDIPAAYTNSDVDTHINTSTASSGEVLSWNGSDYDWVSGSLTGITDNATGSVLTLNDTHIDTTRLDVQYIDNSYGQSSGPELQIQTFSAFDINIKSSQFSAENAFRIDATTGTDIRHTESSPRIQTQSYGTEFLNGVIKIPVLTSAPTSPANGMIAIADGSGWDPMTSGVQTMVAYLDSAWATLSGTAGGGGGTSWQAVKTSAFTAVAGEGYFVNTTSAAITVTLPSSPSLGDEVTIVDYAGTADTNNITVDRNGQNIQSSGTDLTVSVERAAFTLVFTDNTQGWLLKDK